MNDDKHKDERKYIHPTALAVLDRPEITICTVCGGSGLVRNDDRQQWEKEGRPFLTDEAKVALSVIVAMIKERCPTCEFRDTDCLNGGYDACPLAPVYRAIERKAKNGR